MAGKKFDNNHEKSRFLHLEWRVHDTKLVLLGSQQKVLLTEPSWARDTNHAFKVWTDEKNSNFIPAVEWTNDEG